MRGLPAGAADPPGAWITSRAAWMYGRLSGCFMYHWMCAKTSAVTGRSGSRSARNPASRPGALAATYAATAS